MPDFQDQTFPYELLVRFGPNGTPAGAHVQYLRRITLDGEIIKDDILPAEPINLAGFPTSAIMSDATRDALAKIATQDAQISSLNDQLTTAAANATQLQDELAAANATIGDLRVQLAAAQQNAETQAAGLNGQITSLTNQLTAASATIEQLQATIRATQPAG